MHAEIIHFYLKLLRIINTVCLSICNVGQIWVESSGENSGFYWIWWKKFELSKLVSQQQDFEVKLEWYA